MDLKDQVCGKIAIGCALSWLTPIRLASPTGLCNISRLEKTNAELISQQVNIGAPQPNNIRKTSKITKKVQQMFAMTQLKIRNIDLNDYSKIIEVMPEWWGGRDLTSSVLKIFFIYFKNTSFVAEIDGEMAGFLIGFSSQVKENEAYIHFAGVNPAYRKNGIGKLLYSKFFEECRLKSIDTIRSCTSPINKLSISFHRALGFEIVPGDVSIDGIPASTSFLRDNDPKVVFEIQI